MGKKNVIGNKEIESRQETECQRRENAKAMGGKSQSGENEYIGKSI
jgi:hypothetical protein